MQISTTEDVAPDDGSKGSESGVSLGFGRRLSGQGAGFHVKNPSISDDL